MIARLFVRWSALLALLLVLPVQAENGGRDMEIDNYIINYQVFNSTFLTPEVAGVYGVTRARDQALVLVSVREKTGNGNETRPKRAMVRGSHSDLIHRNRLEFREIDERVAIYYIASFRHGKEETHRFKLEVQPDPNRRPYALEFSQKLYHEE